MDKISRWRLWGAWRLPRYCALRTPFVLLTLFWGGTYWEDRLGNHLYSSWGACLYFGWRSPVTAGKVAYPYKWELIRKVPQ